MPLPPNFSEWEHLQNQIENLHNRRVMQFFRRQPDDDISTPKASLKHACLIKDNDTAQIVLMRQWLFEITAGHAASLHPPIYGIPLTDYEPDRKFKPQVKLVFSGRDGTDDSATNRSSWISGEITFRLMNETSESIDRSKAVTLALNIKQEFTRPNPAVWRKGWFKATYQDLERGYDLRLFVRDEAMAMDLCRKVVGIQNHTFNEDFFQFITHDRNFPADPGTHRVYGQTLKKPRRRPRVDINFRYAQLLIWGRGKAVNLVDTTGRLKQAIEYV